MIYPAVRTYIAGNYDGSADCSGLGPFSYKDYLRHLLNHAAWGDEMTVAVLAHLWRAKVTVVNARTLLETRYFHDDKLEDVDVVLVFNGYNHYLGTGQFVFSFLFSLVNLTELSIIGLRTSSISLVRQSPSSLALIVSL